MENLRRLCGVCCPKSLLARLSGSTIGRKHEIRKYRGVPLLITVATIVMGVQFRFGRIGSEIN